MQTNWISVALAFIAFLAIPLSSRAQNALPSGTILPISLDTGLNAAKLHPGRQIRATVMQAVPGTQIRRRAHVTGSVVQVGASNNGHIKLTIEFDAVEIDHRMVPMKTNLRAVASYLAVQEAQIPEEMASRGMTPDNWTTQQIGGEQFYRGGPVSSGMATVGQTTPWGALDLPRTQRGEPCRGSIGENRRPQAMWLFSSDACGVYSLGDIRIIHAGRSNPTGVIILESTSGKLKLGSGTGFLLRVSSPAADRASAAEAGMTGK